MRALIRCDGTTVPLLSPVSVEEVCGLIGATTLDSVALFHMGEPLHVMLVDDHGYETEVVKIPEGVYLRPVRALKPLNVAATELYRANCSPATTHSIVGDVVVVPDSDFEDCP